MVGKRKKDQPIEVKAEGTTIASATGTSGDQGAKVSPEKKLDRRRQINRDAARRARGRKVQVTDDLKQAYQQFSKSNTALKYQIRNQRKERTFLLKILKEHPCLLRPAPVAEMCVCVDMDHNYYSNNRRPTVPMRPPSATCAAGAVVGSGGDGTRRSSLPATVAAGASRNVVCDGGLQRMVMRSQSDGVPNPAMFAASASPATGAPQPDLQAVAGPSRELQSAIASISPAESGLPAANHQSTDEPHESHASSMLPYNYSAQNGESQLAGCDAVFTAAEAEAETEVGSSQERLRLDVESERARGNSTQQLMSFQELVSSSLHLTRL